MSASRLPLSASTDGKAIKVATNASPGTLLHTATASTTNVWDEVHLKFFNSDTLARVVTVQFGATTAPDNNIVRTLPAQGGSVVVVPNLLLQNSLEVRAIGSVANVITASGFVNRITN